MKKLFTLAAITILLVSCTKETEVETVTANLVTNPYTPALKFDDKKEGVYIGTIISTDLQYHAKIEINAGNNGAYSATTKIEGEIINFKLNSQRNNSNFLLDYSGINSNSSFTLDISDYTNPQVTNILVKGKDAHAVIQKKDTRNRADVVLGTYVDINDSNFYGTFDVFSSGTPHTYNDSASLITRIALVSPNGTLFIDETMENFDFTVCTEDNTQTNFAPLMYVNEAGTSAHFYADDQSSMLAGKELTWQIFHKLNDGYYIQYKDLPGFDDGCYETASGLWNWDGRSGLIALDFYEEEVSARNFAAQIISENARNESVVLTKDIIQTVIAK